MGFCGYPLQGGEPTIPNTADERADLLILSSEHGKPLAIDVTVSHPLQPSLSNAEVEPSHLLAQRATAKMSKYAANCAAAGWAFAPIVAMTTGQWSTSTSALLAKAARRWSLAPGKDARSDHLWARMGMSLARGCSQQL